MAKGHTLYARVVLDSPLPQLDHPFDYRVPDALVEQIAVGQKVVVPLRAGNRRCDAWVIELLDEIDFSGRVADVDSIVTTVPVLPVELYGLARTIADRQAGSAVDVLRLAIPPRYVRAEKAFLSAVTHDAVTKVAPANSSREFHLFSGGVEELPTGRSVPRWTTSYAAAAAQQMQADRSTIIVLPDFRDIALVVEALDALGQTEHVVRLDAGLTGAARWTNYLRVLSGERVIVIGNRSSVYAPVASLGLIMLWDDANDAMREPLAPYAHPRDVALVRQEQAQCDLVIGGFVPGPASARLISLGYLQLRELGPKRRPLIATDAQTENQPSTTRIPSIVFTAGKQAIADGPVLVQVAKPGYSTGVRCTSCGTRANCNHCGGPLRLARQGANPSCRWCGRLEPNYVCRSCKSTSVASVGAGSEKTADELGRAFAGARVVVADGAHQIERVAGANTLVIATPGTEPIADGGYAAVFVLDGEIARAREDMDTDQQALNAWVSAAALARDDAPVYLSGTGPVLGKVLALREFVAFVTSLVREREQLGLPPATRAAVVTGSAQAIAAVRTEIRALPIRSILGPVPSGPEEQRLIITCDYKHALELATTLRALIVKTAQAPRPSARTQGQRISRLNVRMDDTWLSSSTTGGAS